VKLVANRSGIKVADTAAADSFYTAAFGADPRVRVRASETSTTGFHFADPDRFVWEAASP
jgi:hypothetical protein